MLSGTVGRLLLDAPLAVEPVDGRGLDEADPAAKGQAHERVLRVDGGALEQAGALGAAQKAYEACLALAPQGAALHNEAALAMHALKRRLN